MWEHNPWADGEDDCRGVLMRWEYYLRCWDSYSTRAFLFLSSLLVSLDIMVCICCYCSFKIPFLHFLSLGNGQWWTEGNQKEFDQRGCQGPPDGHHRRHPNWPIHLWQMQGEELHLHTGTNYHPISVSLPHLCNLVKCFEPQVWHQHLFTKFRYRLAALMSPWPRLSSATDAEIDGRYVNKL